MLAEPRRVPNFPPSTLAGLASVLLKFTRGDEVPEEDLKALLVVAQSQSPQFPTIEYMFLEEHRAQIWESCVKRLINCSIDEVISLVPQMWCEEVLPPDLAELNVLSPATVANLRTIFASMIRVCIKVGDLIEWIVANTPPLLQQSQSSASNAALHFMYQMNTYGLSEESNLCLAKTIPKQIESYIESTWTHKYTPDTAYQVQLWVEQMLMPEIRKTVVSGNIENAQSKSDNELGIPNAEILRIAFRKLGELRISELVYIVEKQEMYGIEDLKQAIQTNSDLRNGIVATFTEHCNRLLLNGASDTVDIILLYLKTINSFSRLDPQGILLEKVSSRIRQVLQERSDTCARLAEGLFGLSSSPLSFLAKGIKQAPNTTTRDSMIDSFQSWEPDPVDTPVDYVRKLTKDSVSTLINLYDNKGVFVQQLANLYANELLNMPVGEDDEELNKLVSHYELMSLRFGKTATQSIGVMFLDYMNSGNIAHTIQEHAPHLHNISPLVLSRLYWPPSIRSNKQKMGSTQYFQMPRRGKLKHTIDEYTRMYKQIPGHDKLDLEWLHDRGRVTISLELKDRTLDLVVQPDQAILISAFDEDNNSKSLSFAELLAATDFEEQQLLSTIQFWMDHNVIGTDGEKYRVLETQEEVDAQASTHVVVADGAETAKPADPFESMHGYWSYIVGMLTNLGSLSLDRIHSFLVMFVPSEDPYVKTKQELESYLLAMVDEGKLNYEDSKYSLVKQ